MNLVPGSYEVGSIKHQLRIGCSGWSYKHWRGAFYPTELPASKQLDFYKNVFDTVEINSSFYKLPARTVFNSWKSMVPSDFLFAVKGSRFITHMKKLSDPELSFKKFFDHISALEEKLGPVLFQLPPRWRVNALRFEGFLNTIPQGLRVAFEFRDTTWYDNTIYDLLNRYNCAFCIYELAGHQSPKVVTGDFVYLRLHGPGGKYEGSYSNEALDEWAKEIEGWLRDDFDVFVYFDNDQHAYATGDAYRLKRYCENRLSIQVAVGSGD
jgi:uncharacterized protein YecE (DUF72 family)